MSDAKEIIARLEAVDGSVPRCRDFDEDCDDVTDKVHCYLYDPAKGFCPFLRARDGGIG